MMTTEKKIVDAGVLPVICPCLPVLNVKIHLYEEQLSSCISNMRVCKCTAARN